MTGGALSESLGKQYSVERELGGGGMARVFVAFDHALGRRIVIKVLHPDLAAAVSLERFRREIRVAATLVHPHIVPLLDAGEADGLPYYTMPYMEGESLRAQLDRHQQLPVAEATRIALDVAGALDYAHRQGVVHRDIKPENILLHDGHAVVTDFGIARAVTQAADASTLTQIGVAVGTPAYMSPEQAAGEPNVDARADVYSLGCVLYEMLAGAPPYSGNGPRSLFAQHFSAPIPRVRSARDEVSQALDDLISAALAKEPAHRIASASQFASGVHRMSTDAVRLAAEPESIAVLPFANLSADADNEYLSDGVTEEIINVLTRLDGMRVAARTSSFSFKGQQRDVRDIAQALSVRHVLQGSVRRAGDRVRVAAQLVDARSGFQLWSDTFDRQVRDVFALQDDIAGSIAERLQKQFTRGRRRTASTEAYDAFLRGRFHFNQGTVESWQRAVKWFEQAVGHDPDFVDARVDLAQSLMMLSFMGAPMDLVAQANREIQRALAQDPSHAEAHAALGFAKCWFDWDFAGADAAMRRAIELNPASPNAHWNYTILCANMARTDEAVAHATRAVELDPFWSNGHQVLQYALLLAGRYRESIARGRVALDLAPGAVNAVLPLAWAHVELGEFGEALAALQNLGRSTMALGCMAIIHARKGERDSALQCISEMEQLPMTSVTCAHMAWANAAAGNVDTAFHWLNRGIDTRDLFMGCMPIFAWWDVLRGDPRFLQALQRAQYPEASFRRTYEFLGATRARGVLPP